VPDDVQQGRVATLLDLQGKISREKNRGLIGHTLDVLVEKPAASGDAAVGRSHREAPEIDGVIRITGKAGLPGEAPRQGKAYREVFQIVRAQLRVHGTADLADEAAEQAREDDA